MPAFVLSLPIRAFYLEPGSVRAAHVATRRAFRNHALETEVIAVRKQHLAVGESIYLAHERDPRLVAKPAQITLALGQRQLAQINAILMQQIEDHEHELRLIGFPRPHRGPYAP